MCLPVPLWEQPLFSHHPRLLSGAEPSHQVFVLVINFTTEEHSPGEDDQHELASTTLSSF